MSFLTACRKDIVFALPPAARKPKLNRPHCLLALAVQRSQPGLTSMPQAVLVSINTPEPWSAMVSVGLRQLQSIRKLRTRKPRISEPLIYSGKLPADRGIQPLETNNMPWAQRCFASPPGLVRYLSNACRGRKP